MIKSFFYIQHKIQHKINLSENEIFLAMYLLTYRGVGEGKKDVSSVTRTQETPGPQERKSYSNLKQLALTQRETETTIVLIFRWSAQ